MKPPFFLFLTACILLGSLPSHAQTHTAVQVDAQIYYILEHAQMRGLCAALPRVKPYSRQAVLKAIGEILHNEKDELSETERAILEDTASSLEIHEKTGIDFYRGAYHYRVLSPRKQLRFEGDIAIGGQVRFGGAALTEAREFKYAQDHLIALYADGDIGNALSFKTHLIGHLTYVPRETLGTYNTYYPGFQNDTHEGAINQVKTTYAQTPALFPYTYRKYWDGFVVYPTNISSESLTNWPQEFAIGPMILGELSGTLLDDMIFLRFGRMRREWGAMTGGRSLVFNGAAQPFMAIEGSFNPTYWFNFSALTGVLEYYNEQNLKDSARTFQSAFSIEQLELNYKDYLSLDIGSSAVWSKRFELGYIFPNNNNFLYQSAIGDFDNMGFYFNLRGQFPGIFGVWVSFFADEINPATVLKKEFFNMDRNMYAGQVGFRAVIPWLPFASLTLSYTKIEPYAYTHTRIYTPWNDGEFGPGNYSPMESSYTTNGEALGYYLPPNSDELLLRFEAIATRNLDFALQYQMIRHGADYGSQAVDGSSFLSELDPEGRSEKLILRKFFLQDGAYQWRHIIKLSGGYDFDRYPIKVFGEAGFVFSYFTGIAQADYKAFGENGVGSDYRLIDTAEYPKQTSLIVTLGFRVYPENIF